MLSGMQIIRTGVVITVITLLLVHSVGLLHEISSFLMGMGCSLSLVGAGRRFMEG